MQKLTSELFSNEFRWDADKNVTIRNLQQKVTIIRHYPVNGRPVGIHTEWRNVICDGDPISIF